MLDMRKTRFIENCRCYHLISRLAHQAFFLDDDEKTRAIELLRRVEEFSGVIVLAYAIMSNHFHIFIYVPEPEDIGDEEILRRIQDELQPDHVSVEDGLALIAVVGQGMIYAKGTAARIFRVIADANINIRMIDQGSSELNIIIAVKETDYELAIRSLYHAVERVL